MSTITQFTVTGTTSGHSGHTAGPHTNHGGHDKHAGHDPAVFRRRFWLTLLISVPVVATSEMIMDWFGST